MRIIKVENVRNRLQTKECTPKLNVGEVFALEGSDDIDGLYIAKEIYNAPYSSYVCKLCPFSHPDYRCACNMYRKIKSGNFYPICLLNCKSYWPRMEIRRLDNIMEDL